MRLLIIFFIMGLAACQKRDLSSCGSEIGTVRKGSTLGLSCPDELFIVKNDNKTIQPVIARDLLNGFAEGDVIRFGYEEVFVGMISCGENIATVKLLCASAIK